MVLFEIFQSKKSDPNIHQNAPFIKNFFGGHAPEPPSKAHGFDVQIYKSQKKILDPPFQILGTPLGGVEIFLEVPEMFFHEFIQWNPNFFFFWGGADIFTET